MSGLLSWFSRVATVAVFNLRSIPSRKGSAISAAVGIACVVAVLVGVLAISNGFRKTMTSSVPKDAAIVLRAGADNEMSSGLTREEARMIGDAEGLARGPEGALISPELFVVINLPKKSTGLDANVPLRGVSSAAYAVRGNVQFVEGRPFESGRNEVVVGVGAAREFAGLEPGSTLKVGPNTWTVVGIFTTGGGVADSEIWADSAVLAAAYQREEGYQSIYVKLASPGSFETFRASLEANPDLEAKTLTLQEFYASQSEAVTGFVTTIGVFIAVLMALGALFGALNTMYSSVSARTQEIATLRALGFQAGPVVASVLLESLVISIAGGVVGALAAWLLFDGFTSSTMNFQSFSQVSFAFAVSPGLLAAAIFVAAVLGLAGGLFPAIRAARLPIAAALREV